jgi:hypothetical protein
LALAGAAGAAGKVTGAAAALTGLRLVAGVVLLRGALTGVLEVGAALEAALAAGLAAALTAGWAVRACVDVVALDAAELDESFMENQP